MNNSDWLDIDVLEDYLDGKLDAKAMHRIERISLEDPFVAEALAGLSLSPKRAQSLSLLQKHLQERVAQKPVEEKRWQITSQRLSIAAAAAVLFVAVSLLFWMRERNNRDQFAAGKPKKVEAIIAPVETQDTPVTQVPKAEIEKVILEQKNATYAATSKKIKKSSPSAAPSVVTVVEAVAPASEQTSSEALLRPRAMLSADQAFRTNASSALAAKVAGMQINRHTLQGTVYDEEKSPVPGATVRLKGKKDGVVTNSKGEFSIPVDSGSKNQTVTVTSLGYKLKEIDAKNTQHMAIELKADDLALNEVVIARYGAVKKSATTGSASSFQPIDGWEKFEAYLLNNNRLLINKKRTGSHVVLRFKLSKNGEPMDIKVFTKVNVIAQNADAVEKEAIRLIKDGPKWVNHSGLPEISVNIEF